MTWWMWAVLGLIFLIGEILTPGGIFIIFFAAGALVMGVLDLAGIHLALWLEIVLFSVLSIGSLLLFRKPILRRMEKGGPDHVVDSAVGQEVVAQGEIPAKGQGLVEHRGTPWKAINTSEEAIADGEICLVSKEAGLKLEIVKKTQ